MTQDIKAIEEFRKELHNRIHGITIQAEEHIATLLVALKLEINFNSFQRNKALELSEELEAAKKTNPLCVSCGATSGVGFRAVCDTCFTTITDERDKFKHLADPEDIETFDAALDKAEELETERDKYKAALKFIGLQPCTFDAEGSGKDEAGITMTCRETGCCITEYCLPCYAQATLSDTSKPTCKICHGSKEFIRMGEPCPGCKPKEPKKETKPHKRR